jgi:hypothetical protein
MSSATPSHPAPACKGGVAAASPSGSAGRPSACWYSACLHHVAGPLRRDQKAKRHLAPGWLAW